MPEETAPTAASTGTTPTILVVDDDVLLRDMYAERLKAEDFNVLVAQNGEEALTLLGQQKPDVILLDIMMPKVNGFNVLDTIKNTPEIKDIPVILLTALIQEENRKRGMAAGAFDYIAKSESMPAEVVAKVRQALKK
jgi:CheY-like chemotaxis protein